MALPPSSSRRNGFRCAKKLARILQEFQPSVCGGVDQQKDLLVKRF